MINFSIAGKCLLVISMHLTTRVINGKISLPSQNKQNVFRGDLLPVPSEQSKQTNPNKQTNKQTNKQQQQQQQQHPVYKHINKQIHKNEKMK